MIAIALIEAKRAHEEELVSTGEATIGMIVLWRIPQHAIVGAPKVLTYIGQIELCYLNGLQSMSTAFQSLDFVISN